MKNQLILFLVVIVLLSLSGCGYVQVENSSGFTAENMTIIEQMEGSIDIYFESDPDSIGYNIENHIWLYQMDNNKDENYKYVVALELLINPLKYDVNGINIEISYEENVQVEYDDNMLQINKNSYDLNYEDNGSSISGHVNVGDYFETSNEFYRDDESNVSLQFHYIYSSGKFFTLRNEYSSYPSMQKTIFVLTSNDPITSIKDFLNIKVSGSAVKVYVYSDYYDLY